MSEDPYEVLGVGRDAAPEDVRRAYRRAALRLHPDKAATATAAGGEAEGTENNAEAFRQATAAYELLNDPERRERYDRFGHAGPSAEPPDLHDILRNVFGAGGAATAAAPSFFGTHSAFSAFFGGAPPSPLCHPPDEVEVALSLREMHSGGARRVEAQVHDRCGACDGSGAACPEDVVECMACRGTGRVQLPFGVVFNGVAVGGPPCGSCAGRGRAFRVARRCAGGCGGSGQVSCQRSFEVRLPPGVPDGHRQLLQGRGGYDVRAGRHKDLLMVLRWPSLPEGVRVDAATGDVDVVVPVELADVMCGFARDVELFDGADSVRLEAAAYAAPDALSQRLPGRGLTAAGKRGELRVRLEVVWPQGEASAATLVRCRDVLLRLFGRQQHKATAPPTEKKSCDNP
jgi:molecular chaperone DnaJ